MSMKTPAGNEGRYDKEIDELQRTGHQPDQPGLIKETFSKRIYQAAKSIRFSRIQYMLIFSLAPIFPRMKSSLISNTDQLFGLNATFVMGIAYSLGIGLVFLSVRPEQIHRVARWLSVTTALLFISWNVVVPGKIAPWLGMIYSLGFGGCAGIAFFGFTYALNDIERFFGAAITVLYCMFSQIILTIPILSHQSGLLYLSTQVLVTLLCLTRFNAGDYLESLSIRRTNGVKPLSTALFLFIAHRAAVFFYSYLPHASPTPVTGIIGISVILFSLYVFFTYKFNTWYMVNLFFAGMSISYLIHLLLLGQKSLIYADSLQGFGFMGYIVSYYLLGTTLYRYADFKRFRLIFLVIILNSFLLLHVAPGLLYTTMPLSMPLIGGLLTFTFFLAFAILSPTFSELMFPPAEKNYELRWIEIMQERNLTAREQEIVRMLLEGSMLKEVAVSLDISLDTVKFHSRNIYRKLDVRGRNELLNFFKDA